MAELDPVKRLGALSDRFWWLRGVAAALALAALVPNFIELKRFEYLLALHLLVVAWTAVASKVGAFVGQVLSLPPIPHEAISTLVFASAVALPATVAMARYFLSTAAHNRGLERPGDRLGRVALSIHSSRIVSLMLAAGFLVASVVSYYSLMSIDRNRKVELTHVTEKVALPGFVDATGAPAEVTIRRPVRVTTTRFPIGGALVTCIVLLAFGYALWVFQKVRRGFIFVVTFLLASQVLYFLSAPWLAGTVCDIAKTELSEVPAHCKDMKAPR